MIEIITWLITGVTPLLMNNPEGTMRPSKPGVGVKKRVYDDAEEAKARLYGNAQDGYHALSLWFRSSILKGGCKGMRIGKLGAATVIAGGAFPIEETCLLVDKDGELLLDYEIDVRRVVIQGKGILRARPKFNNWFTNLVMEVDTEIVDVASVTTMLQRAGKVAGVGDYRPAKGGWFGRFTAEEVVRQK